MTAFSVSIPPRRIEGPIFVVGCCNSGTTILWRALLAHPDVHGPAFEGQDLDALPPLMRHFLGRRTFRMFAHPTFRGSYVCTEAAYATTVAARIDAVYAEHALQGKRFIEKSPANAIRTRFLQALYPDASFVMIVRNGFAVSEGIVRRRTLDPDRPHMAGLATSLADAALQWRWANERMIRDRAHLRRSILITYEDLVADPGARLADVCRFCQLDPTRITPPTFDRDHNTRQIARLSTSQINTIARLIGPRRYRTD